MVRCILFLCATLPAVGCCVVDPCTAAWECCCPLTGTYAGFHGFRGGCGPGPCGGGGGACGCGPRHGGCGLATGYGLFDGRCDLFDGCCLGRSGCGGCYDGCAPVCQPVCQPICQPACDPCPPSCAAPGYVPTHTVPSYGHPAFPTSGPVYTTPIVGEPQFIPGVEVSPVVPPPDAYPTSVSPTAVPPIRNTYSWRRNTQRS